MRWSAKARGRVSWLAFVYRRHGQLVNVKYRSMNKEFMQVRPSPFIPVLASGMLQTGWCHISGSD